MYVSCYFRTAYMHVQKPNQHQGHFQHLPTGLAYNGIQPTVAALSDTTNSKDAAAKLPTLHRTL